MGGTEGGGRGHDADLVAVVVAVAVMAVVLAVPTVRETPVRAVVGLPFVLLVPGYAFVAALLPGREEAYPVVGRLGLSIGGSVAVVSGVGLLLEVTVGFNFVPLVAGICLATLLATSVARIRRRRMGAADPDGSLSQVLRRVGRTLGGGSALSIVLTVVVLATTVGAAGVVVTEPDETPAGTELYVLGERGDGSLSAGAYPTNLTVGQPSTYVVGVGTAGGSFDGTVVARLQTVAPDGTIRGGSTVVGRFPVSLGADRSTTIEHTVTPESDGPRRLTYRLYRGDPASNPVVREVHVFVSVAPAGEDGATADSPAGRRVSP